MEQCSSECDFSFLHFTSSLQVDLSNEKKEESSPSLEEGPRPCSEEHAPQFTELPMMTKMVRSENEVQERNNENNKGKAGSPKAQQARPGNTARLVVNN